VTADDDLPVAEVRVTAEAWNCGMLIADVVWPASTGCS
jgi:hypothetical protein